MMVDQAPDGLEVLRGSSSYIYDGNWKLQAENGADGYHVSSVHIASITIGYRTLGEREDIDQPDEAGGETAL
jgi:benzoate/toluate 1,2-dioxygenase alpha subunit